MTSRCSGVCSERGLRGLHRLHASRPRSISGFCEARWLPWNLPAPGSSPTPIHVTLSSQGTHVGPLTTRALGTWAGKDDGSPSRSPPDELACHHCTPGPMTNWAVQHPIAAQDGTSCFNNDYLGPEYPPSYFSGRNPPLFCLVFLLFSVCFP